MKPTSNPPQPLEVLRLDAAAQAVELRGGDFDRPFSAFGSVEQFKDAQRMATLLSQSTMVPEQYRGPQHLGDCVIALEIANRIGASVLAVMQNLVVIYGRPSWSAQFQISCLNASRRFSPLRYKFTDGEEMEVEYSYNRWVNGAKTRETGKIKIRNRTCVAWAIDKSTGEVLEGPEVSIKMAVEEGWYAKDGSKWKTMEQLMLSYRAAGFFTRVYAPELTMGIQTSEEVIDVQEVDAPPAKPVVTVSPPSQPIFGTAGAACQPQAPNPPAEAPADSKPTPQTDKQPAFDLNTPQGGLAVYLTDAGVSFDAFRRWAGETERLPDADSFGSWDELPVAFCESLRKDAKSMNKCVIRCKS